ncbi:hypothetical protein OE88DRAFT_1658838 [Heliocybe sulcata]|uniref:Uncharacterized protein n=1 Tax=Heliocybe sulcata TaxID=5364 RepID=A0A5C3N3W6_9AGAM|nr:hypothetical protein OE88DRAFT_1658838 [Heliocybe sulcata]
MSLDQNLFTLNLVQRPDNPLIIDLVDNNGTTHYRKQRVPGTVYKIELLDPLSESVLSTATAPSPQNKHKTVELYNPNLAIDLKYSGTLSTKWKFKWEEHEFEWKKEECYIVRKPDPPVLVAITKEPTSRSRTWTVQILDYNINRFDVDDRKGLEIVILTALLTFGDANETHLPGDEPPPYTDPITSSSSVPTLANNANPKEASGYLDKPPTPPPKPAPKTGVDRIAEMQAERDEINEVTVEDEGLCADYAQYCYNLIEDEAMLFITVRSADPDQVPKVLHVVEEAKRLRHKAGIADQEELHQYVVYDTKPVPRKGPRVIKLDSPPTMIRRGGDTMETYRPPTSLTVHLSKIPMPELQPTAPKPELAFRDAYPTPDHSPKDESPKDKGKGKEKAMDPKGKGKEKEVPKESSKDRKKREKDEKEREKKEAEERERERKEREKREKESPRQREKREKRERELERKENEEREKREKKEAEEREKLEKKEKREREEREKVEKKEKKEREERERKERKLNKRRSSSTHLHVHSHEMHPHQPSPSPSQLNNPGIYAAPAPPRTSRPSRSPAPHARPLLRIPADSAPGPNLPARPTTLYAPHARYASWSGRASSADRRLSTVGVATDLYDAFNMRRT